MKKVYEMEDVDCANCAAKMEKAISELPEVISVSVNFLTQRMSLELKDDISEKDIMKKIVKLCRKVDPDSRILLP